MKRLAFFFYSRRNPISLVVFFVSPTFLRSMVSFGLFDVYPYALACIPATHWRAGSVLCAGEAYRLPPLPPPTVSTFVMYEENVLSAEMF